MMNNSNNTINNINNKVNNFSQSFAIQDNNNNNIIKGK